MIHKPAISFGQSKILPKAKSKDKKVDNDVFKLKLKNSSVFYNEIQDPIEFEDNKEGYTVGDLKLNMK